MKFVLGLLAVLFGSILAFAMGGLTTFFGLLLWDANVMHDHDGQAGIGFMVVAFWAGLASAILAGISIAFYFWRRPPSIEF
jgi:hypothetical protein